MTSWTLSKLKYAQCNVQLYILVHCTWIEEIVKTFSFSNKKLSTDLLGYLSTVDIMDM